MKIGKEERLNGVKTYNIYTIQNGMIYWGHGVRHDPKIDKANPHQVRVDDSDDLR
jgi:hypothetical protein